MTLKDKATSQEERSKIYQAYLSGMPKGEIVENFNRSLSTIDRIIRDPNRISKRRGKERKTRFNDDYFEVIDTQEKAYWLGLLFADGNVYKCPRFETYKINLGLLFPDKDHIKKFAETIEFDFSRGKTVKTKPNPSGSQMETISLTSKKMFQDLEDKGCVRKKALVLEPPKIDEKFFKSFIRGYYDGDGGCYLYLSPKEFRATASFTGTLPVVTWIQSFIEKEISVKTTLCRVPVTRAAYSIKIGGIRKTIRFFDWLYEDFKQPNLERKLQKAKDILEIVLLRGPYRRGEVSWSMINQEEINRILERFLGKPRIEKLKKEAYDGEPSCSLFYSFLEKRVGMGNKTLDKKFQ